MKKKDIIKTLVTITLLQTIFESTYNKQTNNHPRKQASIKSGY